MATEKENWLSFHIFCHDLTRHDALIKKLSDWTSQNNISEYFFIRYWEGGPHVRFRIKGNPQSEKEYLVCLRELLKSNLTDESSLNKEDYYSKSKMDGQLIPMEELPWYENHSIVPIDYIRESARYGGEAYIEEAEKIFHASSELVVSLLKLSDKFSLFLRMVFYTSIYEHLLKDFKNKALNFNRQEYFYRCYSYWQELYELANEDNIFAVINQLTKYRHENKEKIEKLLSQSSRRELVTFRVSVVENFSSLSQMESEKMARSVLFSQMHMLANRLGIPIEYEFSIYKYFLDKNQNDERSVSHEKS